jgi:hypothetical protein
MRSRKYFSNQFDFIKCNYNKSTSRSEFENRTFFCSAFVVACYTVVGLIDETAQAAYIPHHFSPGHLSRDNSFGWLLGYIFPGVEQIFSDESTLNHATQWRNFPNLRWW